MKTFQFALVFFALSLLSPQAYGLEAPGLKKVITIETDGYQFEVEVVGTFEVDKTEFSKDDKKITLYLKNGITNNLGEMQIPINLIDGNFTLFLDGEEIFPKVQQDTRISFITFEFEGAGDHTLEVIGTTYLPEFSEIAPVVLGISLIGIVILKKIGRI